MRDPISAGLPLASHMPDSIERERLIVRLEPLAKYLNAPGDWGYETKLGVMTQNVLVMLDELRSIKDPEPEPVPTAEEVAREFEFARAVPNGFILVRSADLERVWLEMRRLECPQSLRDLIWDTIGKVL